MQAGLGLLMLAVSEGFNGWKSLNVILKTHLLMNMLSYIHYNSWVTLVEIYVVYYMDMYDNTMLLRVGYAEPVLNYYQFLTEVRNQVSTIIFISSWTNSAAIGMYAMLIRSNITGIFKFLTVA